MKMVRVLLFAALVALPVGASSLTFTLTPALETATPQSFPVSVGFSGTLTDTDAGDICDNSGFTSGCLNLNDISFTFDQNPGVSLLTGDSDPFFNNIAGFFSGQGNPSFDSVSGVVFGIVVAPNTPIGVYTGTVSIVGEVGAVGDSSANTVLDTENWTLDVAPEPAPFGLMIVGLGAFVLVKRVAL